MTANSLHFLSGKKIVIAGAGIGGLAFVISLKKVWNPELPFPELLIYDRDPRQLPADRAGYSLSFNGVDENGGMVACRDMGILQKILDRALVGLPKESGFHIWDNDWSVIIGMKLKPFEDLPSISVRVRRSDLREVLVEEAEKIATINWATRVTSAEHLEDGTVRVHIAPEDGSPASTQDCQLLVAADGAHSKVRASFRPEDELKYRECVQFGGLSRFPDGGIPVPLNQDWGMIVTGQGAGCFFSPVDKESVVWAISRWEKDGPRDGYNKDDAAAFEALKQDALQLGKSMAEPFPSIVNNTVQDQSFVTPTRDKVPFAHDASLKNVIFIGDANHCVSSFAGNGANLALKDGWDLAKQLTGADSAEEAVAAYDALSLPRAQKTLKDSHDRMNQSHYSGFKWTLLKGTLKASNAVMSIGK